LNSKTLTFRFLENLTEAFRQLNNVPSNLPFNPALSALSALILTGAAALSYDLKIPIMILFISMVLISVLNHSFLSPWIKTMLFALTWASIVSAPLPFITAGEVLVELPIWLTTLKVSFEGICLAASLITRVTASVAIFTAFIMVMGWRGIIAGFEELRMPKELSFMLNLSIISIPIFLRETLNMLLAREARIMRKIKIRNVWRMLATVIGELMLRGYERAWRLDKSIRARSFSRQEKSKVVHTSIKIRDVALFLLALTILLLGVIGRM
jgi:energy-coupling factor transporter transmembrane protein EcfT